jgi:hypothetical protein
MRLRKHHPNNKNTRHPSKAENQRLHFIDRMRARFDIDAGYDLQNEIILCIQKQSNTFKVKPVKKPSQRITLFEVVIYDKAIVVVYDRKRKSLVTALTAAGDL